ncbi:MAG: response regulator [Desulfobacteraceae bacterium]|nr:response regulator [Desulfobacteraceae bacterium]MCF8095133.1 response regulator [Desulfobacteraceae bacterium]
MIHENVEIPDQVPVLVVDDETPITEMIYQALSKAGYECHTAQNGEHAMEIIGNTAIDVVITDIRMPGMNGVELLEKIKAGYDSDVMVMTGFTENYDYESIVTAGASDFIQKPISFRELMIRLKRVLRMRYLLIERDRINRKLEDSINELEKAMRGIEQAHKELDFAYLDTVNRLVSAAEYKDEETGDHIVRMSRYCALIAEKLKLSEDMVKLIRYASPMHDIGKIGIPDNILVKPGRLTKEEFETIKSHTTIGAAILADSKADVLKVAREIAFTHHEKWNGTGYPNGLKKENTPISGRIVGIADTFDALTSRRPYKDPYPVDVALKIIRSERGESFDPSIVDVFMDNIKAIKQIKDEVDKDPEISLTDFKWSERDRAAKIDLRINLKL